MAGSDFEIVVVGAGAAGIGAARRLREAGADALLIEARTRPGGRAWTVDDASGFPLDLGCGWLHSAESNPWRPIAEAQGRAIDKTLPPWSRATMRIGEAGADGAAFAEAMQRFRERVHGLDETAPDRPASSLLDSDSGWNGLIDAVSTYYSGVELDRVSTRDLARYDDSGVNWRVAEGYGTIIADHALGLPVRYGCAAQRIDRRGQRLRIETTAGTIIANAVIVTLPTNLLASRPELFLPALPDKIAAAADLPLGLADKLFLSLAGADEFALESRAFGSARTATAAYHFRPFGRPLIEAYFGGALAVDLEAGGERAFADFAIGELVGLFGAGFARRVKPLRIHRWGSDPLSLGSYSCALPGKADSRAALAEPVESRVFFAGEACSREAFSTAHGAYATGVAAADAAFASARAARSPVA